jgi:hypothetical protein
MEDHPTGAWPATLKIKPIGVSIYVLPLTRRYK